MQYNAPGNIDELSPELLTKWADWQSKIFKTGIAVAKQEALNVTNDVWIFNPITDGTSGIIEDKIGWTAFPKKLLDTFANPVTAWRIAERSRNHQEEYCEWEVIRDPNTRKLLKITFTTETPDYYHFLNKHAPDKLLELYHRFVNPNLVLGDLRDGLGRYNTRNIWNFPEEQGRQGILMHMGQINNTFGAAVNLAAEATWPSSDGGNLITDEQGLIRCRGFGDSARHSDPHIGARVNSSTRQGNTISIAGPVGLYIEQPNLSTFETPDGSAVTDWWKIERGTTEHMVRISFQAPQDSTDVLGDCRINGRQLSFGGQIAEFLTISIRAIAKSIGQVPPTLNCRGQIVNKSLSNFDEPNIESRKNPLDLSSPL